MKIYFAGGSGAKKREIIWLKHIKRRLLTFYELQSDMADTHFQQRAFKMIKKINKPLQKPLISSTIR